MNVNTSDTSDSDSDNNDRRNRTWSDFSDLMEDEVAERLNRNNCFHGFFITFGVIGIAYTYYYIMTTV